MKTIVALPVGVALVGMVALGYHFWGNGLNDREPPVKSAVLERTNQSPNLHRFKGPRATEIQKDKETKLHLAQIDSDTYFNRRRFAQDQEYAQKCRKHLAIHSYQNSSRRGDPGYEKVLHTLLKNGYGVEDWVEACTRIMLLHQPLHSRRVSLEQRGYSEEEIQEDLEEFRKKTRSIEKTVTRGLVEKVGITDPNLIAEFMSIPIVAGNNEDPFGRGNSRFSEGDRLLTDHDWMTSAHKDSQTLYQGNPRPKLSSQEKFKQFREWQYSQRATKSEEGSAGTSLTP